MFNISASMCMSRYFTAPSPLLRICVEQYWFASFPLAATEKPPLVTLQLLGQTHKPQLFPHNSFLDLGQGSPCPGFDLPPPPPLRPPSTSSPPRLLLVAKQYPAILAEHGDAVLVPRSFLFFFVAGRRYGLERGGERLGQTTTEPGRPLSSSATVPTAPNTTHTC